MAARFLQGPCPRWGYKAERSPHRAKGKGPANGTRMGLQRKSGRDFACGRLYQIEYYLAALSLGKGAFFVREEEIRELR